MNIKISVYKASGKWYASEIVPIEKDKHIFTEEFQRFIRDNVPANIGEGFIVVDDVDDDEDSSSDFHNVLYRYGELFTTYRGGVAL